MGQRMIKNWVIILFSLTLVSCDLEPPTNGSEWGTEASEEEIVNAFMSTITDYPQEEAFQIGDYGAVESLLSFFGQEQISAIHDFTVTKITEDKIYYVDVNRETQKGQEYPLDRIGSAQNTVMKTLDKGIRKLVSLLPPDLNVKVLGYYTQLKLKLPRVTIEKTTALGSQYIDPYQVAMDHIYQTMKVAPAESLAKYNVAPQEAAPRYYGLKTKIHNLFVPECSDGDPCSVEAIQIKYNEVQKRNGEDFRIHHHYEFSKEVPGMFSLWNTKHKKVNSMLTCLSATLVVEGKKTPITECQRVAAIGRIE